MTDQTNPTVTPITQATLDQLAAFQKAQEEAAAKPSIFQQLVAWEKANSRLISGVLSGIVVKSAYTKTAIAIALALLGMGCVATQPTVSHAKVDCFAAALQPVVGDIYDTQQLVRDMVAGKASLAALLQNLQVDEATAKTLLERLNACSAPAALPDAGTVGS